MIRGGGEVLPPPVRGRTIGLIGLALCGVVLPVVSAACGGAGEDDGSADVRTPAPVAEAPAPTVDTIDVFLEEYLIDIPARLPAGSVLRVVNSGREPHNLRLGPKGTGEWVIDMGDLDPGGTRMLDLDLPVGSYDVICDLAGHDMRGMRTGVELVETGR